MTEQSAPTFETALAELERLVSSLERNDGTLEESIDTFQRATELAASCRSQLDTATLRITELMPAPEPDSLDDEDEDTDDVPF